MGARGSIYDDRFGRLEVIGYPKGFTEAGGAEIRGEPAGGVGFGAAITAYLTSLRTIRDPSVESTGGSGPIDAVLFFVVVGRAGLSIIKLSFRRRAALAQAQKGAETIVPSSIVAQNGTKITGFAKHGIDRVIGDTAKRAGTKPAAILDALKNPNKIVGGVDPLGRPFEIFTGKDARVIVNPVTGKIISVNPLSGAGAN